MVNTKPTSRGRARVVFTRRPTLACSGRPNQRSPVLLAPPRRTADAGRQTGQTAGCARVSPGIQWNKLEIWETSTYTEWFAAQRDHRAKTCSQSSHRHPDQTAVTEQPR